MPSEPMSDAELTRLALAADPEAELGDDAVCLWDLRDSGTPGLLPSWYMPSATGPSRVLDGWARNVAFSVIAMIVLINAVGLCVTYGWVTLG
jgi:hypothetical protein